MIFISAGHHLSDSGAVSKCRGGVKESSLTIIQRDLICKELDVMGVKYISDRDVETLGQYLSRIKPGNGSVLLELHFNASSNNSATGIETLIADDASIESKKFAKEVNDVTVKVLKLKDRGVKSEADSHRGKLGFMRGSGVRALLEICFISNCQDVDSWFDNKEILAKEIAKVLIKFENLI